jgi:hypothetical protein
MVLSSTFSMSVTILFTTAWSNRAGRAIWEQKTKEGIEGFIGKEQDSTHLFHPSVG